MKFPITATALFAAGAAFADTPVLTVMTYDSFVSDWGPGPAIEKAFEETCGCDLVFTAAGDGAAMLSRLKLEGARTEVDVLLGIDTNLITAAKETGLFAVHGKVDLDLDLPIMWDDATFLPYDWGYFAFVYDKKNTPTPPTSFVELAASDLKIVIQDPRSSTPGLGLMHWVGAAYEDDAAIWEGLADNVLTVTKGWSEAYGLFLEGEADMVLSYTTSPAYHLIAEEDDSKGAAPFTEGHYMQVEVAGKLANSDQSDLADAFMDFMLTAGFQAVIPTTNWMYPAVLPEGGLPKGYDTLIQPSQALLFPSSTAAARRDAALETWRSALSQ